MNESVEDVVLEIYRRQLRQPALGPDDDFLGHGGHSLIAFRILAEFRRIFPVTPQTEDFADLTTAAAMAGWLRRQNLGHGEDDEEPLGFPGPAQEPEAR